MKRFDSTVAVVTGASSGIGRQLAIDLARRGAVIVGLARRAVLLEQLRAELQTMSEHSDTVVCDVADTDRYIATLADIERRVGPIDVLVNNAGIEEPTPVSAGSTDLAPYMHMLAVNYLGAVAGTLAVIPRMLERGSGVIANMCSDVARAPGPGQSAYAASKAALAAFTESVAHEVAPKGVRLHVVYPGWVPTAMGMAGANAHDRLPPKLVRRTEAQVSERVLERLGRSRIDINAAWLPLLAPIGRTLLPSAYQRGMQRQAERSSRR